MNPVQTVLPWQQTVWAQLRARHPRWPHALLLSGASGTGKRHFAGVLVAWLLCAQREEDRACGECSSCQWLQAGTHPAFYRLSPQTDAKGRTSKVIKIDQVRELQGFVQQTQSHWRVVLVDPAERLNPAAANALLKTLEEPGEQVLFVLVSDQLMQLPATVRSRVQRIELGRVDASAAQAHVQAQLGVDEATAQRLLRVSAGAPLRAMALHQGPLWALRAVWLADWQRLLQSPRQIWDLSAAWQKKLPVQDFFELLSWMVHDVLALKLQQPVWQDDLSWGELPERFSVPQLVQLQGLAAQCAPLLAQNVQEALVYDRVLQQLRPAAAAEVILNGV